ncbi:hypothetical protein MUU53_09895 [Rhizobium lemnae]|uniref:Helix-turn-helix transcriptional regulator n=1 Tax=Rhizobium lemnae TaxID=1214924 RepID=A0ABV8E7M9_9HYPH|nr:hypothetical protein [Rhizobium lemnae]MCJ8508223.1 hypothetical protein [Rhizobium lemnae]
MLNLKLIDQIYEAAFVSETWETVCCEISLEIEAYSASLITIDGQQSFNWVSSPNIRSDMERFSSSPLRFQNIRPARHEALSPYSFMRDVDLMTEEEIAVDPIYTQFLHPLGLGWTVGDMIKEPSGHTIIFDIIRERTAGPFEQKHVALLNTLRPHLARAATTSSRIHFEKINAAVRALELVDLPAAIITHQATVLAANSLMEDFSPQIVVSAYDRLIFGSSTTNAKFQEAITRPNSSSSSCSLPLPRTEVLPPAVVHLVPIRGNAKDIFTNAAYFVIATSADRSKVIDSETLQGLFDLSPAEARVARSLAMGNDVATTAREFGISIETARSHVKSALSKCGMTRQVDLIANIITHRPLSRNDESQG